MNEGALNLLLQIPLAGLVVFETWLFLKHLASEGKAQRESQSAMQEAMLKFIGDQSETNRQFLATQREQMNSSLGRFSEEIKALRIELAKQRGTEDR